jgi:exopolyphosphatase/guanosine-5'-triphosphate,3'-diphosphate pyrophosphatase
MSQPQIVATIDLGSNSFHMLISQTDGSGGLKDLYAGKSKVQLRSGLKEDGSLTKEAQTRALDCLRNFSYSIEHYQAKKLKVVGTYTLRKSKEKISDFLKEAEKILGTPIEVISGEEEARLIYVGASAGIKMGKKNTFIIDIGGGSTELVIGKGSDLKSLVSLEMGCVSMQDSFFADNRLTLAHFSEAIEHAKQLIEPVAVEYKQLGWEACFGASGTIKSISDLLKINNITDGEITRDGLEAAARLIMEKRNVKNIHFPGIRSDREDILAGGFCVLYALFDSLDILSMHVSAGALREGIMYELVNKLS